MFRSCQVISVERSVLMFTFNMDRLCFLALFTLVSLSPASAMPVDFKDCGRFYRATENLFLCISCCYHEFALGHVFHRKPCKGRPTCLKKCIFQRFYLPVSSSQRNCLRRKTNCDLFNVLICLL